MDWSDEPWIKVYTRDTPDWVALPWEARALFGFILRRVDRAGVLDLGKAGVKGLAVLVLMPLAVVERSLPSLLEDGCLEQSGTRLLAKNFIEAQAAVQSDKLRKREQRTRTRDRVRAGLQDDNRQPVVYYVQSELGGPVKIGFTEDLGARLADLQVGRADTLLLLGAVPGTAEDEKALHLQFADIRVRGEWYRPEAVLLQHITGNVVSRSVTGHALSRAVTPGHSEKRGDETRTLPGEEPGKPAPAKARRKATDQPALPGSDPGKETMPFTVGQAFDALRSDRFVPGKLDSGIAAAITARIRGNPDLSKWQNLGAWWAAGGGGYRTDPYGPKFIATSDFNDHMGFAQAWHAAGRPAINGKPASRPTGIQPPAPASAFAAATKAGVALAYDPFSETAADAVARLGKAVQ